MRILILGAAVSGRAAAHLALSIGDRPVVFDGTPGQGTGLLSEGISVVTGDWEPDLLDGMDAVVASPGFSIRSRPSMDALERGVPMLSELEYGSRRLSSQVIGVTGTNGKTTVTELTAAMLSAGGVRAVAAGNIGLAVSDVARADDQPEVVVVEASSFQLTTIETFHPQAAVLLNLAPDHLDWHGSFEAYAMAKTRIFENQVESDLLIYGGDDPEVVRRVHRATPRKVPVSGIALPAGGAGREGDALQWGDLTLPLNALTRDDEAFLVDVAAAMVAANALGASTAGILAAASAYRPSEHRRRIVAERSDITYVDDSKATNPHAALAAVMSYRSVVLIAGGRNKGLDLAPLAQADRLRAIVAIGEAAPELADAAEVPVRVADSMDEAVATATSIAQAGDVVLLAPGCASFDMYENYAARGEGFVQAVERLMEVR